MFKIKSIQILNLGYGNINNVYNSLKILKFNVEIVLTKNSLRDDSIILIPGVGSFGHGIKQIDEMGIREYLQTRHMEGFPIIGICLGMQVLFESSEETAAVEGLSLFEGKIQRIPGNKLYVGWSRLQSNNCDLDNLEINNNYFYFNHNYAYLGTDKNVTHKTLDFDSDVCAIYRVNNTVGFQFHPEKSQESGLMILQNTIRNLQDA